MSSFADMTLEEDEKDKEFLSSVPSRDLTDEVSLHMVFNYFSTNTQLICLDVHTVD